MASGRAVERQASTRRESKPGNGFAKVVRDSWLLFRRSAREGWRNPTVAFILPTIVPFVTITLTSQIFRDVARLPSFPTKTYVTWEAPGVVLLAAMMGAGYSATALVIDARSGYLDRLRLLPVHPAAILVGRLLFDAARVLPAGVCALAGSIALGADFRGGLPALVAVLGVVVLWALAYEGLFYAVALRTKNPQAAFALLPLFVPLMFLSTVFVPTSMMPVWVRHVSAANPFTYVIELTRGLMTGQVSGTAAGRALLATALVSAATWSVASRSFAGIIDGD